MNCFYHPEQAAVAQCVKCMKGLCKDCATVYDPPYCESCAEKEKLELEKSAEMDEKALKFLTNQDFFDDLKQVILISVISLVLGLITYKVYKLGYTEMDHVSALIATYFSVCIPFGIRTLHKGRGGTILLCIPILGWALYIPLATLIGAVSFPVSVIKLIVKGVRCVR